jgi:hypothetical protein
MIVRLIYIASLSLRRPDKTPLHSPHRHLMRLLFRRERGAQCNLKVTSRDDKRIRITDAMYIATGLRRERGDTVRDLIWQSAGRVFGC